jgi:hypothetical protein
VAGVLRGRRLTRWRLPMPLHRLVFGLTGTATVALVASPATAAVAAGPAAHATPFSGDQQSTSAQRSEVGVDPAVLVEPAPAEPAQAQVSTEWTATPASDLAALTAPCGWPSSTSPPLGISSPPREKRTPEKPHPAASRRRHPVLLTRRTPSVPPRCLCTPAALMAPLSAPRRPAATGLTRARLRVLGKPRIEDITADGRPLRGEAAVPASPTRCGHRHRHMR